MPPYLMDRVQPGMGPNDQFVVGMSNVGFCQIDSTMVYDTARTDAQLIASPPNTNLLAFATGPVVHSLGVPPAMINIMAIGTSVGPVNFVLVTADNSAIYIAPYSSTANGAKGIRVRVWAMR